MAEMECYYCKTRRRPVIKVSEKFIEQLKALVKTYPIK